MKVVKSSFAIISDSVPFVKKIELAGRVCYKSEGNITEDSYIPFIKKRIETKHLSILEHSNILVSMSYEAFNGLISSLNLESTVNGSLKFFVITDHTKSFSIYMSGSVRAWMELFTKNVPISLKKFLYEQYPLFFENPMYYGSRREYEEIDSSTLTGQDRFLHHRQTVHIVADRGFLAEITRHRKMSFSVESTRYCNYSKDQFGNEITFIIPSLFTENKIKEVAKDIKQDIDTQPSIEEDWYKILLNIEKSYLNMVKHGASPQLARSILPMSLKTEMYVTGNLSDWDFVFSLRTEKAAHPDMQEIMIPLKDIFLREVF